MDEYIGAIVLYPYTYTPQCWLECNGQQVAINQFQALFSLLGSRFGGDGRTTFGLPDLRNASPFPGKSRYCICYDGEYPIFN